MKTKLELWKQAKRLEAFLNDETDKDVHEWLTTVPEAVYEVVTALQKTAIQNPGTRGKMILARSIKQIQEQERKEAFDLLTDVMHHGYDLPKSIFNNVVKYLNKYDPGKI